MYGEEDEISLFSVNEEEQTIVWTNQLIFDTSIHQANSPITINIGFRSDSEGVYERKLRIYHVINNVYYLLAEILVNAESIGEDERFRTLLGNFGLPDPKDFPKLFKETDINEDLPDWELVNQKSKHMILEHDHIMPYIGTYKALINAIKWLGYEDIFIREWFKNVKDDKLLSLLVSYDAKERSQTILRFDSTQRKVLKKLNQLSLNYCLTRETGEKDEWGTPLTENCYEYNIQEVFMKLMALKTWLEKNIIGVNCRITDITGEGIYIERYHNLIYSTDNIGFKYSVRETMTPKPLSVSSELVRGDASVRLTLHELMNKSVKEVTCSFGAMIDHLWDPSTGLTYHLNDASALAIDPTLTKFLKMGSLFSYPFRDLKDIQWKLSVEKPYAGVIGCEQVTNPLFIYENEIKFYNTLDTSSIFHDVSTDLNLLLESAYFRDPSIDVWEDSIAWTLSPNASANGFTLESSTGVTVLFDSYMNLVPNANAKLQYAVDANYKVPLLSVENFTFRDASSVIHSFSRDYFIDIVDGKIAMDAAGNNQLFINFQYDTSLSEQMITLNAVYQSDRIPLFIVDPSEYYWADPVGMSGGNSSTYMKSDNNIHTMTVNHIGDYHVEIFGWDGFNTLFYNKTNDLYNVWIKTPTIYTLLDTCVNTISVSTNISFVEVNKLISQNPYPIYDKNIVLQGLTVKIDSKGEPYVQIPSITYFQDVPEPGSKNRFFNLTERVLAITDSSIVIDSDYQNFYKGDSVNLVKFNKNKYELVAEASSYVSNVSGNVLIMDNVSNSISIDSSSDVYILNNTYRSTRLATNNYNTNNLDIDISGYTFRKNQLVALIITDTCTNYSWGSSYRVLSSPTPIEWLQPPATWFLNGLSAIRPYTSWISSGLNVYSAVQTVVDSYSNGLSSSFSIAAGGTLTVSGFLTHNSGSHPYFVIKDNIGSVSDSYALVDGSNTVTLTATRNSTTAYLVIETNNVTNYSFTGSVAELSTRTHTLDSLLPQHFIDDASRYKIEAKHAFSTYANFTIDTAVASEKNNKFDVYLKDSYCHEYYLDDTFVFVNVLFDQEKVNAQWYNPSDGLFNDSFYFFEKPIIVDTSTLVILKSQYDSSTYMLNHKNIWTVKENISKDIVFKVYNDVVPYVFNTNGYYDVVCEAYDSYGNLEKKTYEGLIHVI
jgi:hypothetical protein